MRQPLPAWPPVAGPPSEFGEAVRRMIRTGRPALAIAARLSRLQSPPLRPHHTRVARAILNDAAFRHGGQVFTLPCQDLVLLCQPSQSSGTMDGYPALADLPDLLARLLRADMAEPGAAQAVRLWMLPEAGADVIAYAREQEATAARSIPPTDHRPDDRDHSAGRVERLLRELEAADPLDILRRQTAILLGADSGGRLQPLHREITCPLPALEARIGPGAPPVQDPYLLMHLATRLGEMVLGAVEAAFGGSGPLDPACAGAPPLQLHLRLSQAAGPRFAAVAASATAAGAGPPGVTVPLLEALAEPEAFVDTARHLRRMGCLVAIGDVAPASLPMVDLSALTGTTIRITWSEPLTRLPVTEAARIDAGLARIPREHLLLGAADREAALRWGVQRGIRRFQGAQVDAMLAGTRLAACAEALHCTLRQCRERHFAASGAGRRGCRNHALLNAAAPHSGAAGGLPSAPSLSRRAA